MIIISSNIDLCSLMNNVGEIHLISPIVGWWSEHASACNLVKAIMDLIQKCNSRLGHILFIYVRDNIPVARLVMYYVDCNFQQ